MLCVRGIDFVYVSTIYCVCCVLGVLTLSMFLLFIVCVRGIDFVYVSTIYCVCCVLGVSTLSMFLLFIVCVVC